MIYTRDLSRTAVICRDTTYSYKELLRLVHRYSLLFSQSNYSKIAIYSENCVEWIAAFYAGWKNGCIVVPIDHTASPDDVRYILDDCRPELLFAGPALIKEIDAIEEIPGYAPKIHFFGDMPGESAAECAKWRPPEDIDRTALIIYTSGTTGSPKGVMLSYRNILANLRAVTDKVRIFTPDRQVLMLLPLHHIFPLAGSMMAPLYVGAAVVMAPSMQSADLLETLRRNQVAIMIGVPRLYELLYRGIKSKIDASPIARLLFVVAQVLRVRFISKRIFAKVHRNFGGALIYMVSGGAALPKTIGEFFQDLGFSVLEGFGMTEAAPMITFTRPDHIRIGSPGKALPGMTVEIRDGEVVAKGDNIMQGYYNRPRETAEVIRDGWLHTGDLGYFDKDGSLYLTGRKKDILVLSNGKNVNPVELETACMQRFSVIKEAAVFLHEDQLYLAIVPRYEELTALNVKDIDAYFKHDVLAPFNASLAPYKRVMKFTLIKDELPRTKLGKIQRFRLAEYAARSRVKKKDDADGFSDSYRAVKQYLQTQIDMDIHPDDHIEFDLGLDSLGKLGLISFIESSFGVKLDEKNISAFPSVHHLAEYIRGKQQWFRHETVHWRESLKKKLDVKLPVAWPTQNIIKSASKYVLMMVFRFRAEGVENIPDGPCIIAPNHQSFLDGLFVASFLGRRFLKGTYFYAKKKHVNNAFLRFLARTNNVIVMDMERNLNDSIHMMAAAIQKGKKVIIFPEGTRSSDGRLGEFKKTFAILSMELNVPVIPVAINGAYRALPAGSKFPRFGAKVTVQFLPPVYPEHHTAESLREGVYQFIGSHIDSKAS